jgi:hypothetical protein
VEAAVMFKPCVVKSTMEEISPVVPFEERTIVFEVEPIPVMPVPGRVVIISIAGEVGFADSRGCIVSVCVYRSGSICTGIYDRGGDIYPWCGYAKTYAGSDKNLGITFGSDEAGGYDGCKDK